MIKFALRRLRKSLVKKRTRILLSALGNKSIMSVTTDHFMEDLRRNVNEDLQKCDKMISAVDLLLKRYRGL